jgi:hypothetical protein
MHDTNGPQRARIKERREELRRELDNLDQQERDLGAGEGKGGPNPVQPGSASRTSMGEPGKFDAPGRTGQTTAPQPAQAPRPVPAQTTQPGAG